MTNKNNIIKIKNIEDLKNIQIVCKSEKDIENCLNMLEELGFEVRNNDNQYKVIFYREYSDMFENDVRLGCGVDTYFYNKKFIKNLQKLKKDKLKDIEITEDKRITKINNYKSKEKVFIACDWDNRKQVSTSNEVEDFTPEFLDYSLKYGLVYATEEARDRALFKLEIETKLKNLAERLNNGKKINWEDKRQPKFNINYDFIDYKKMYCNVNRHYKSQGTIYCLDENFLEVAKKEIGEDNLIKYFKE